MKQSKVKAQPQMDAMLTLTEIVELITERVRNPNDTLRQAKDKVRKKIRYALKIGKLHNLGASGKQNDGLLKLSVVVAWARGKWPDALLDLRANYEDVARERRLSATDHAFADVIPGDLTRCQRALKEAQAKIRQLDAELANAKSKIIRLQPLADHYEATRATNRESAQKSRKHRW